MPAALSPSITAIRLPACMPSSLRSTARSTWMRPATSASADLTAWQPTWRRWRGAWARSRWRNFARTGQQRNSHKKRAARVCKRPKSREETPKEGNDSSRYRIAIKYTAMHKNQGSLTGFPCLLCIADYWIRDLGFHPCEKMGHLVLHRPNLQQFTDLADGISPARAVADSHRLR